MADNFRFAQLQPYSLSGSGAITGATTIILKSMLDIDGNPLTMAGTFGTIGFGTLEPGNGDQEEQMSFTGLVNNSNGTVSLTGVKNVLFTHPYTQTSGLSKTHPGSSTFIISNTSGFYDKFVAKNNDGVITETLTFSNPNYPEMDAATPFPTGATQLATKAYVDSVATGGATYDQEIVAGIAGETLVPGNLAYFKTADARWWLTDADTASTVNNVILGFVQTSSTAGNAVNILISGMEKNQSSLSPGVTYYASNTPGAISSSPGTTSKAIGKSVTATTILLDINFAYIPTSNEKDALVSTSGSPNSTNKYVSENDTSNAATITAITIAFTASTKTISDSGSGFVTANFRAGDSIIVTGTSSNNGTYTIVSVAAGAIVVVETLVNESAGGSFTLTTATINKVVRYSSTSQVKVPTTPVAAKDAASKDYVDTTSAAIIKSTAGGGSGPASASTQTITHGLGRTPKIIRVYGYGNAIGSPNSSAPASSSGVYNNSGNNCVYVPSNKNSNVSPVYTTAFSVYLQDGGAGIGIANGFIQNITSTAFDIVWTFPVGSSVSGVASFMWEAE